MAVLLGLLFFGLVLATFLFIVCWALFRAEKDKAIRYERAYETELHEVEKLKARNAELEQRLEHIAKTVSGDFD